MIIGIVQVLNDFRGGLVVKNTCVMQETQVQSLGQKDPLGKEPTPVFLPGKSHGQRSLMGYSPWGQKRAGLSFATKTTGSQILAYIRITWRTC